MNRLILGPLLGAILGRGLSRAGARAGAGAGGGLGGRMGGGLGGLGGALGGRGALIAMLLPYAMQWIQRNGGLGAVLGKVRSKGFGQQAQSWVATGENQDLEPEAMDDIVGREELSRLSQQLGVPEQEVKQGFAEILPEMVNQLTPDGELRPDADRVIDESLPMIEEEVQKARLEPTRH